LVLEIGMEQLLIPVGLVIVRIDIKIDCFVAIHMLGAMMQHADWLGEGVHMFG